MNVRWHWTKLNKVKTKQRLKTRRAINSLRLPIPPLVVTITRIGPGKLDDDNLAASCKYVRDEIAFVVGIDDGSPLYTWRYEQRCGPYGVEVEITPRTCP